MPPNITVPIAYQAQRLTDNDQWIKRVRIISESGRAYIISQNKARRHWGCSCQGYRTRRQCKHLSRIGLPINEQPWECDLLIPGNLSVSFYQTEQSQTAEIVAPHPPLPAPSSEPSPNIAGKRTRKFSFKAKSTE
jgi:hypothetical protein